MSVLSSNGSHLTRLPFLDGGVGIARYDRVRYPFFLDLTEKLQGFFWRPQLVNCSREGKDFKSLNPTQQRIWTKVLKRQIVLDTYQGRSPALALLPIVSLPEIEEWILAWSHSETIHSKTYTHVLRNVFADPSKILDEIESDVAVMSCSESIARAYDRLIWMNNLQDVAFLPTKVREHKKRLWLALHAINALEGIRFYASFAVSWNFAELKKMEGNAKLIKLICRDENLHLAGTQQLLKILKRDDPDFAEIAEECTGEVLQMYIDVIEDEKAFIKDIFSEGSMVGLNEPLLCSCVEHFGDKRMRSAGVESPFKKTTNPLPWMQKWISGQEVQPAPQETELESYTISATRMDVTDETLSTLSL